MTRLLVLYEDRFWRALRPLTDTLPVPALAFGASNLAARWRRAADAPLLAIEARGGPLACWREAPAPEVAHPSGDAEALAINAAALPGPWLATALGSRAPALFVGANADGRVAGARLPLAMASAGLGRGERFESHLLGLGLPSFPVDARFVSHPWNLIEWNASAIEEDLASEKGAVRGQVHRLAALESPERITVEEGARVDAFAVLDARRGPIRIGRDAVVASHSLVAGPCVIGASTEILGGLVSRSTIGPQCRIAGEVDECVWQGWANKRHHGFVGHSVIGEWANLGALTTTSDLKNNYGPVRVWVDGREIDSGLQKVGSFLGTGVRTGIGTLLPTGASVGVGSNLFGGGRFAPKRVPSFGWWDGERMEEHQLEKFLATARVAMSRRGRNLLPAEETLMRQLFEATALERRAPAGASAS